MCTLKEFFTLKDISNGRNKDAKEWVLLEKYLFCYLNRKLESHVKPRNIIYIYI